MITNGLAFLDFLLQFIAGDIVWLFPQAGWISSKETIKLMMVFCKNSFFPFYSLNTSLHKPLAIFLPFTSRWGNLLSLPMSRSKPEIMTFHCYTGEMNEARNYHPINNGLLTAVQEISSPRLLRPQTFLGSVFNLERMQENVVISRSTSALSRNCLSILKTKRERVGRKDRGDSTLEVSHKKEINISCPLWGRRAHGIWNAAGFDICLAGLSVKKNLRHDKQWDFPKGR